MANSLNSRPPVGIDHATCVAPKTMIEPFTLVSLNLHGFQQGLPVLQHLSEKPCPPSVIFTQECWLTSANMYKINNFSPVYSSFGKSAMDKALSSGILRGRPFGGVTTLVRSDLCRFVTFSKTFDRFVLLILKNLVLVNIYLPSVTDNDGECRLIDLLTEIQDEVESAIQSINNPVLILGGDFNLNFESRSRAAILLNKMKEHWSLNLCNNLLKGNLDYTYYHETLQQRSMIDYFLIPASCWLSSYQVLDLAFNLSDHLPIEITIHCSVDSSSNNIVTPSQPKDNFVFRDWSIKNRINFYDNTRANFERLQERFKQLPFNSMDYTDVEKCKLLIEQYYADIVSALLISAKDAAPIKQSSFRKPWWDDVLDNLKAISIEAHRQWIDAGRPLDGPLFVNKQKAKSNYRKRIADNKNSTNHEVSNSLQNLLLNSDQIKFWKVWHNKFGKKSKNTNCIDGLSDHSLIANRFADVFASTCRRSASRSANDLIEEMVFREKLASYRGAALNCEEVVNIESISKAIKGLENGKAAGFDLLTAEYLKYCHPIVISSINKLFIMILNVNYVPDAFGIGVTVPLLKSDAKGSISSSDSYRGITIMPVISKLLEIVLLDILKPFLNTCNSQFGYKKGLSCSHVVYSVRKTVEYFTMLNSTVNVCALDISKAFDKINHTKLFTKMMERNVPRSCILLLMCWYAKSTICVRWENEFSHFVTLDTGVRQGSSLSPNFFALFVDGLLSRLKSSGLGCHIKGMCFNSLMYADDLLLLTISITHLQKLINICHEVLDSCDLKLNPNKSVCLRVGPRFKATDCKVFLLDQPLCWKSELKHLGITIVSGRKFKCSLQLAKQKFFSAANGVLGKIGVNQHNLILSLVDVFCIPVLLYGTEALLLSKSDRNAMDFTYSTIFFKIFNVKETRTIKQCQFYSGCLPTSFTIDLRVYNFLNAIKYQKNSLQLQLFTWFGQEELIQITNKYLINAKDNCRTIKDKLFDYLESELS